ncbi:MAG TPA: hypothetical protein VMZ31_05100 [Phycisphaerae bacterium]|nr:hypothetical protein [Phycisphaerae bacterium]
MSVYRKTDLGQFRDGLDVFVLTRLRNGQEDLLTIEVFRDPDDPHSATLTFVRVPLKPLSGILKPIISEMEL